MWAAVKDNCYFDKPETFDALKNNIREAIGGIELKNWTDRVGYYLWGAVKDKCYADMPETIDALKDNIR